MGGKQVGPALTGQGASHGEGRVWGQTCGGKSGYSYTRPTSTHGHW